MSEAILIVSFGGPDQHEDVMPFLENVLRGKNVPRERMLEVAEHYYHFDGRSPINDQNRELIAALQGLLEQERSPLPIYWGNRNWHPLLADTLARMKEDGVTRAYCFMTSAYSSYSGCRQYRENLIQAQADTGAQEMELLKLRVFFNHPGFIEPMIDLTRIALEDVPEERRNEAKLLFTAHSIPLSMANGSKYVGQVAEASRLVAEALGRPYELVYQSKSGAPGQPWLEPDILARIEQLAAEGVKDIVCVPIGFISDHMEVLYDLDTEARTKCETLGVHFVRVATVGTEPRFIAMIRELVEERRDPTREKRALGALGPSHDVCPLDCCPAPAGRPR